jgi:VanZ family protein
MWLLFVAIWGLAVLALRGNRWAYLSYVVLGLAYFPISVGFQLNPRPCQLAVDVPLALRSMTNFAHIVHFALFFVITSRQLRIDTRSAYFRAGAATVVMGALVEGAQAVTGSGNCRVRDLVPDSAGAVLGAVLVLLWSNARMRLRTAAVGTVRL